MDISETVEEKMWRTLKGESITVLTIHKRVRSDGPPGKKTYIEYIVTDKKNYEDIDWGD